MYLWETIAVDQPMLCDYCHFLLSHKLPSDIMHGQQVSRMVPDEKR